MAEAPPARRRLLGAALRRHRESLGYRLDDAARILECDRSKISRIESGQRGIRPRDLRDLLTEYGVAEQEQQTLTAIAHPHRASGWWQPYTDVLPAPCLDYLITEAAASRIEIYQPQQVPDLLQTPDYARAVAAADPALSPGQQDLILESMLTRQQQILGEQRPDLAVVIGEAALHQVVGGPDVMRAQLTHLAQLTAIPAHPPGPPVHRVPPRRRYRSPLDPALHRRPDPGRRPSPRPLRRHLPRQPPRRHQPHSRLHPAAGLRPHPSRHHPPAPGHGHSLSGARLTLRGDPAFAAQVRAAGVRSRRLGRSWLSGGGGAAAMAAASCNC